MDGKNQPDVSVILCVYNARDTLEACLDCLVKQSLETMEVIIIDDGSTDGSAEICHRYASDGRFRIFRQENHGIAYSRNAGLSRAQGKYIGFCDADDMMHPDYFRTLHQMAVAADADIAVCGYRVIRDRSMAFDEPGALESCVVMDSAEALRRMVSGDACFKSYVWNKLFRRELFEEISFLPETHVEDMFVIYRLLDRAESIVFMDWKGYLYAVTPGSITNSGYESVEMDYVKAWMNIRQLCEEKYPELVSDAKAQEVSAAIYTLGLMRKSHVNDPDQTHLLKELIYKDGREYWKTRIPQAGMKRKWIVFFMNMARQQRR